MTQNLTPAQIKKNKKEYEEQGYSFSNARLSTINFSIALENLKKYQFVFKSYFDKYSGELELSEIEKEENLIYEKLFFLWRRFANSRFKKSKDISKEIDRKVERVRNEIDDSMDFQLGQLVRNKLFEDFEVIENENEVGNIFIVLYHEKFIDKYMASLEVLKVLQKLLNRGEYPGLERFVVEFYYKTFVIIPLIDNLSQDLYCLRCSSKILLYRSKIEILKPTNVGKLTDTEIGFLEIQTP